jgi:hypothetical protein
MLLYLYHERMSHVKKFYFFAFYVLCILFSITYLRKFVRAHRTGNRPVGRSLTKYEKRSTVMPDRNSRFQHQRLHAVQTLLL